jgi:hypothetical protein
MSIHEADWKLLRKVHPLALERFCARILAEAANLATSDQGSAHERYLALYKLVRDRNSDVADAFDDMRRSRAIFRIAQMHRLALLSEDEVLLLLGRIDSVCAAI